MMNSTEPVVYRSEKDYRWRETYSSAEQIVESTYQFMARGFVLLERATNCISVDQGQAPVSPEDPYRGCRFLWCSGGTEMQHLYSLPLPNLAYADDGEVKFVGYEQDASILYCGSGVDGSCYSSTVPIFSSLPAGTEFCLPPDQPEPWTTDTVWVGRAPLTTDLGVGLAQSSGVSGLLRGVSGLLHRLEALQSNVDSDRWTASEWPRERAFADARVFIELLPLLSIPLPYLSLADDGEMNFLWQKGGVHIDLGFYGTGTYSYFAHGKDGEGLYGDDVSVFDGFPTALAGLFEE